MSMRSRWSSKMWCIYKGKYYIGLKKKLWMNLEDISVSLGLTGDWFQDLPSAQTPSLGRHQSLCVPRILIYKAIVSACNLQMS